jgi:hypothetical protein
MTALLKQNKYHLTYRADSGEIIFSAMVLLLTLLAKDLYSSHADIAHNAYRQNFSTSTSLLF